MSEEKKEPWLNYLALTTVVLAVCATLSTFRGGGASSKAMLNQVQASDKWAYYQAKSVKLNLYEMNQGNLELERKALAPSSVATAGEAFDKKIADCGQKIAKYNQEKDAIQAEARELEKARDEAQKHGKTFGLAVIFLQIAILLSSIAALLKKKPVWILGMAVGLVGLLYFVDGFLLFL